MHVKERGNEKDRPYRSPHLSLSCSLSEVEQRDQGIGDVQIICQLKRTQFRISSHIQIHMARMLAGDMPLNLSGRGGYADRQMNRVL